VARSYGTGQLYEKHGAWYGRWRTPDGGRVNRKVGAKRAAGSSQGLTGRQAERELQRMIDSEAGRISRTPGRTVGGVGELVRQALEAQGRKRSHVETFASHLRVHLVPHFGEKSVERVAPADVERLMAILRRAGRSPKTVKNVVSSAHSIFEYALRRGWVVENPCRRVDQPVLHGADPDVRFLTLAELDAVLSAAGRGGRARALSADDVRTIRASPASAVELARRHGVSDALIGRVRRGLAYRDSTDGASEWALIDPPLFLMAAMTGMRQGELLALRWQDVDWLVQKVRVRQSFVRGEFGAPKSKRSSRGVPLALRVAAALERLHQATAHGEDSDLVFCHPGTGRPLDRSQVLKRLKRACRAAGVREMRFHDLRHTFGTTMAAGNVPLRTLQEWMGHRDIKTTQIYADYAPGSHEAQMVEAAFDGRRGVQFGVQSERNSARTRTTETT
jgi:integrase